MPLRHVQMQLRVWGGATPIAHLLLRYAPNSHVCEGVMQCVRQCIGGKFPSSYREEVVPEVLGVSQMQVSN